MISQSHKLKLYQLKNHRPSQQAVISIWSYYFTRR
nr:MAG TPA: hypothetical protein [Caudoviricetes sp.]